MKRAIFPVLFDRIKEPRKFIQVLLGPRQVGKTTLVTQLQEELEIPAIYASADIASLEDLPWIEANWNQARKVAEKNNQALLIIDEIQKIPNWSALIKKLWDEDTKKKLPLKVILLGSSPWLMQKGLTESLAGRFEIMHVNHWSYKEMHRCFGWDLNMYLYFGGYPGPVSLANPEDASRWRNYINDSLIETTISRDILLMSQVNKPILLRRLFQLGCRYSSQILSYQKMIGQLQDVGNTTTLAHYLELLSGAGLVTGINKFAGQNHRTRSSSPKLQVLNNALFSAQNSLSYSEALADPEYWGRCTESAVGAHLVNAIKGTAIELYYWREGQKEVDFILKKGSDIVAIEVKSSLKKSSLSGLKEFCNLYRKAKPLLVGNGGLSLEEFFLTKLEELF
jgi:uncharacterized protein